MQEVLWPIGYIRHRGEEDLEEEEELIQEEEKKEEDAVFTNQIIS